MSSIFESNLCINAIKYINLRLQTMQQTGVNTGAEKLLELQAALDAVFTSQLLAELTPVVTEVECPVQAEPVSADVPVQVETPVEVEQTVETPVEVEPTVDTPVDVQVETPVEPTAVTVVDAPVDAVADSSN
jgi:hypothetical protein